MGTQGPRWTVQSGRGWWKPLGHSLYPSNPLLPSNPHWGRGRWAVLQPTQSPALGERWGAGRTFNYLPCAVCQYQLSHSQTGLPRWVWGRNNDYMYNLLQDQIIECNTFFYSTVLFIGYWTAIEKLFDISPMTDWASRCKQIMKVWRKVSAADKVPYLVSSVFIKSTLLVRYILNAVKDTRVLFCVSIDPSCL